MNNGAKPLLKQVSSLKVVLICLILVLSFRVSSIQSCSFQVGPYTFREEHVKTNITFQPDYTVQYRQKKFWYFDAERSNGSLDDEIYTLNMIAVAASDATRYPGVENKYLTHFFHFQYAQNPECGRHVRNSIMTN